MKHIKRFDEIKNIDLLEIEKVDEGLKEWIISGALALALHGGAKSQTSFNQPASKDYSLSQKRADSIIKINFGNEFGSGIYKQDKSNAESIKQKLAEIAKFIKDNSKKHIVIHVNSSESLVPNVDIETGKRLPQGALANRRAESAKGLITDFMDALTSKGEFTGTYKIDTTTKIGTTPFKQGVDDKNDNKYTKEQSIEVTVSTEKEIESKADEFAVYAKMGERIFKQSNKHALGDIYYKTRSTANIKDAGNLDTGKENVLLKTLGENGKYDGKVYLIPSDWWNQSHNYNVLSDSDMSYIESHFRVK